MYPRLRISKLEKNSWKRPLNKNVRDMIKRKARLWTRFMETHNPDVLMEYKRVRNKVRQETRKVIKHGQYDMSKQCKHNPKKFWNYVNSKFKSKQQIGDIKVQYETYGQSTIISKDEDKAAAFGDFFSKYTRSNPLLYNSWVKNH